MRRAGTAGSLHCPLRTEISPHADAVQRRLDRQAPDYAPMRFAHYAARLYPDAEPADLRLLAEVFTWFFRLDDTADETTPSPQRLRGALTAALAVFGGATGDPALTRWWSPLRQRMPSGWRTRFTGAVRHHFNGLVVEADARHAGRRPGLAEYVRLRRATSAGYVAHTLAEVTAGTPLPDAAHHHRAVRAYSAAGNDLLSWFNDLFSLDRDRQAGHGHNLVLVLAAERGTSVDAAVGSAVQLWRQRMDDLAGLRAAVPEFGAPFDEGVRRFLDGVDRSVRGTIDWSLETARYRLPDAVAPYL